MLFDYYNQKLIFGGQIGSTLIALHREPDK